MPDEEDSASNLLVQTLAAVNLFWKICHLVYEIRQSGCSWGTTGCDLFSVFFFWVVEFGALGLQYSSVCSINQLQKTIAMKNLWINVLLLLLAATFSACGGGGGGRGMIQVVEATFYFNFYEKSCPHAEKIVKEVVLSQFKFNQGTAPGILRLFFHDCFVEGCDASLLLDPTQDNPTPEKTAIRSLSLRGYEVIDIAKQKLEAACPGVVSCADILAFAARDSVKVTGGPSYKIKSGRRDGRVSCASQVPPNIPSAGPNITELIDTFAAKNLSVQELVTLSGAHTIGHAHCKTFAPIRNYAIDAAFAKCVNKVCPTRTVNNTVSLDATTPYDFDNVYFQNLAAKKGLLPSDEILFLDPHTNMEVLRNAKHFGRWKKKFVEAMIKMGTTDLKLGTQGDIRNNCRKINS